MKLTEPLPGQQPAAASGLAPRTARLLARTVASAGIIEALAAIIRAGGDPMTSVFIALGCLAFLALAAVARGSARNWFSVAVTLLAAAGMTWLAAELHFEKASGAQAGFGAVLAPLILFGIAGIASVFVVLGETVATAGRELRCGSGVAGPPINRKSAAWRFWMGLIALIVLTALILLLIRDRTAHVRANDARRTELHTGINGRQMPGITSCSVPTSLTPAIHTNANL